MESTRNDLEPIYAKLARGTALDASDREAFLALPYALEAVRRRDCLVQEGQAVRSCCMLVEGFVSRHKMTKHGKRQIVSFHQGGDIVDLQHLLFSTADHTVEAVTDVTVAWIADEPFRTLLRERPLIAEAVWRDAMIDASIFREWVLNVGRRDAKSRIAHMLCEVAKRAEAAGLGTAQGFQLPLTQEEIGDATGLTSVHVNRMLGELIEQGAVARRHHTYVINDWERMCGIADFDDDYLHQEDLRLREVA